MLLARWRREGWHIHMAGLCAPSIRRLFLLTFLFTAAGECRRRGLVGRLLLHVTLERRCFSVAKVQQLLRLQLHRGLLLCVVHGLQSAATAATAPLIAGKQQSRSRTVVSIRCVTARAAAALLRVARRTHVAQTMVCVCSCCGTRAVNADTVRVCAAKRRRRA